MKDRLLVGNNIPENFRHVHWDDYECETSDDVRKIKKIRQWRPTVDKTGMLLIGKPGLGKTLLAAATLNEFQHLRVVTNQNVPRSVRAHLAQEKYPVYFIQLAEFVQLNIRMFRLSEEVKSGIRDTTEYLEIDRLLQDLLYRVRLLVVDDVGKEHTTSTNFAEDAFDYLVRTRHNKGFATIFTSNVPLTRWNAQYSEAMRNFIQRTCLILDFK